MNETTANLIWKVVLFGGGVFCFWLVLRFVLNLVEIFKDNKSRLLEKFKNMKNNS